MSKDSFPEFDKPCFLGPPDKPGVYGVFEETESDTKLIYIGSSKNIKKRVLHANHHYTKLLSAGKNLFTRSIVTNEFYQLEKKLIWQYRPVLNLKVYVV